MENQENMMNYANTDHKVSLNKGDNNMYNDNQQYYGNNVEITNLDADTIEKVEEIGYNGYLYENGIINTNIEEEADDIEKMKYLQSDAHLVENHVEYDPNQCDELTDQFGNYLDSQTQGNYYSTFNLFNQITYNNEEFNPNVNTNNLNNVNMNNINTYNPQYN